MTLNNCKVYGAERGFSASEPLRLGPDISLWSWGHPGPCRLFSSSIAAFSPPGASSTSQVAGRGGQNLPTFSATALGYLINAGFFPSSYLHSPLKRETWDYSRLLPFPHLIHQDSNPTAWASRVTPTPIALAGFPCHHPHSHQLCLASCGTSCCRPLQIHSPPPHCVLSIRKAPMETSGFPKGRGAGGEGEGHPWTRSTGCSHTATSSSDLQGAHPGLAGAPPLRSTLLRHPLAGFHPRALEPDGLGSSPGSDTSPVTPVQVTPLGASVPPPYHLEREREK